MHEMGIAEAILDAVRTEAKRCPGAVPQKVGVRIGELAAIDEDALRFCFDAIVQETDLAALKLEVEVCPRRHRCLACGQAFIVQDYVFQCPHCRAENSEYVSGDELELAYIEVEENGSGTVGTKSPE